MRILREQERRDSLIYLLIELSSSQSLLQDKEKKEAINKNLEEIYYKSDSNNFRHYYSDIFAVLTVIDSESSSGSLDILAENIQVIKDDYKAQNHDEKGKLIDISQEILKLYDHTNLDISRINYTKRMNGKTKSDLAKTELLVDDLSKQIEANKEATSKAEDDLNKTSIQLKREIRKGQKRMQNEYVTILGIFAAIVLAFTGGMTFTSSVLRYMHLVSIYRLIGVTLIIGLVLFNLIWLLIDFIRDINGKNIRKKWIPIVANATFIVLFLLTCLGYFFSLKEKDKSAPDIQSEATTLIQQEVTK